MHVTSGGSQGVTRLAMVCLSIAMLFLTSCAVSIPADPDGTLDRARNGELRVGVSHNPPWTVANGLGVPSGIEADLILDFAASLGAQVAWTSAGEEQLMTQLDDGELDVVIGGLTRESPWTTHAALTTAYAESPGPDGSPTQHVLAVRTGENALMVALERHALDAEVGMVQP